MVSSTTPRDDARWPPVFETVEIIVSLSSDASWLNSSGLSFFRSLGELISFKRDF